MIGEYEPFSEVRSLDVLCVTRLPGTFDCCLVLAQVDERCSQTSPVRDAGEKQLRRLIELILEALLANFQDVSNIGHAEEVFHVMQTVRLGVGIGELSVDLRFADRLASHLKEADEVVMFASVVADLDELSEVGRILGLDVGIWKRHN